MARIDLDFWAGKQVPLFAYLVMIRKFKGFQATENKRRKLKVGHLQNGEGIVGCDGKVDLVGVGEKPRES